MSKGNEAAHAHVYAYDVSIYTKPPLAKSVIRGEGTLFSVQAGARIARRQRMCNISLAKSDLIDYDWGYGRDAHVDRRCRSLSSALRSDHFNQIIVHASLYSYCKVCCIVWHGVTGIS